MDIKQSNYFPPLVVDLDGTLIYSDLLHESILILIKSKPWLIFLLPYWLLFGKARFKSKLASLVTIPIASLPYNYKLIEFLTEQKNLGRKIVLCTASNTVAAQSMSDHLGFFDEVIASDENINLTGSAKANDLINRYGKGGFDYAGNSYADLAVWYGARRSILVNAKPSLEKICKQAFFVDKIIARPVVNFKSWASAFRLHQWVKNLLIFVPAVAAHTSMTDNTLKDLILAFLSFSLCSSSVYVLNDLLDLESDRRHPRKRYRQFASGKISILVGISFVPLLILLSVLFAKCVGIDFLCWLLIYLALTTLYSLILKRLVIIDVLTLAILYTIRVIAGASAINISLSFWILAFSIFLFFSLAFVKRDVELRSFYGDARRKLHGRGYIASDAQLIQQLGISSGYAAVLVLALYINSENVMRLYRMPELIWGAVPLLLWWLSWIWFQVNRGQIHDDPIVFAFRDKTSLLVGTLFLIVFAFAR